MKKYAIGLIAGLLLGFLLATTSMALASNPIRLIVNGTEVPSDPAPQMIGGRVFVPVRFVAEALGAKVEWDDKTKTVNIIAPKLGYHQTADLRQLPQGYYGASQIGNALHRKYPDTKIGISPSTGELFFGEDVIMLPVLIHQGRLLLSITPLVERGLLTSADIETL